MRTTSLRLRVIAAVLAVLAVVLVSVGLLVNVVLGDQLRADLEQRLVDRAGYAQTLAGQGLDPQDLADQLAGDDVAVTFVQGGDTVVGRNDARPGARGQRPFGPPGAGDPGAPGGPVAGAVISQSGDRVSVTAEVNGGTLTLSSSAAGIRETLTELRGIELVAGVVTLLVTGLLLTGVVGVALRPLTRMTELFVGITRGGRGGRLRPTHPHTEIGRTAAAIDDMLQALETAESSARTAAATAAAAEERMRQLLADVSHELRTPVAGLQASAETLLRDNPDREGRERLTVGMIQETHRAARLVGDLLLMTRLDHGELDPGGSVPGGSDGLRMLEPVDLGDLAERAVTAQRLLAPLHTLLLEIGSGPLPTVTGDAERFTQIVTNLLENARYATGPGGRITVLVRVDRGGAEGDTVRLSVHDDGAGVPAADRDRIFDRFVRLDPGRTSTGTGSSNRGGSGLGLPIARALARAHGGTLVYEAGAAPGATFVLTLPAASVPVAVPVTGPGPSS